MKGEQKGSVKADGFGFVSFGKSLLNKGGRKKEDIGEEHGGDIMALEFNRVGLDVTGRGR
ncbi:hypothetical protein HanIR_Chr13g0626441 [Helianthus annuus]|nr:hypothetical protein HanIR_Chr13g0626441 [Helianthus annuus]